MKPEVLVRAPLWPPALAALEARYLVHRGWEPGAPRVGLRRGVRALVTTGLAGFTEADLAALPDLEMVACYGGGREALDLAAARARGLTVTATPIATAAPVADLATGLLLATMRRICEADRFVRAGRWPKEPVPVGRDLAGATCGILGLGRIGRAVAARAEALGMLVCWTGPRAQADVAWPRHADVVALARAADCLVVTCAATPATRGLVDAHVLDALGPTGHLINVARASVVDRDALVAALAAGRIAGAALDVYWGEPAVPDELLRMDNVVLTPHVGTGTLQVRARRRDMLLESLEAHFAGRVPPYPID